MKKRKLLAILLCVGISLVFLTSCSGKKDSKNPDKEVTQELDSKLSSFVTDYLDVAIKGSDKADVSLDSQYLESANEYHDNLIITQAFRSLHAAAPAAEAEAPSGDILTQAESLWDGIFADTRYEISQIQEEEGGYMVTLQTEQMLLYQDMYPILSELMNQSNEESGTGIHDMLLTALTESYSQVAFRDPDAAILHLTTDEEGMYQFVSEELDDFLRSLVDLDSIDSQFSGILPQDMVTEATPNQEYPQDIAEYLTYPMGEDILLQEDGNDVVLFSIDNVEVTDSRSEYDTSNPEKVVVITYSYENLSLNDPVLFDQLSFQILDGDTVCSPYYLPDDIAANPADKGAEMVTATLSYGVSADCNEITICFSNSQFSSRFKVIAPI